MEFLIRVDLDTFTAVRTALRDVHTVPVQMHDAIRGEHHELGSVVLIQDGDGAFLIADHVRFIEGA